MAIRVQSFGPFIAQTAADAAAAAAAATAAAGSATAAGVSQTITTDASIGAANAAILTDKVPSAPGADPDLAMYGANRLKVASLVGNRDAIVALAAVAATVPPPDKVPGASRGLAIVSGDGYIKSNSLGYAPEPGTLLTATKDDTSGVSVPAELCGAPAVISVNKVLYLYGGFGESTRLGGSGAFLDQDIFTPSPGIAGYETVFMGSGGVRPNGNTWRQIVTAYEAEDDSGINPVFETGMVRGAYKIFDTIKNATTKVPNIGVSSWCQPGAQWKDLNRGTNVWNWMMMDWTRWVEVGKSLGYRVILAALINKQGINDAVAIAPQMWAEMQDRSAQQLNDAAKRVFNQSQDIPFYITQPSDGSTGDLTPFGVSQAAVDLALRHGLIRTVGGATQVDRIDGTHPDSINAAWENELDFLGVADDQMKGNSAYMPPCVLDNWRTGQKTWRLMVGAPYPLINDTSGKVIVTTNIAGLYGWQVSDTGSIVPVTSILVVGDGGASLPGVGYIDLTLTNNPSDYGELLLGIGQKQGPGGGLTTGSSWPCKVKANVSGGVVTGFTSTTMGGGWTSAPDVVISGAGTGATAHTTLSGGVPTIVLDSGGSGYGGTTTYARVLRQGAGRTHGARHTFGWNRGAFSSIGWDSLASGSTANPRPLNEFLLRQWLRLKR